MPLTKTLLSRLSASAILAAACLAVAAPASASAATVGIGDNAASMFLDPNFQALHTQIARRIIPYDFYRIPAQRQLLSDWLANAKAAGIEPLIPFEHCYVHPRKLPSVSEYHKAVVYLRTNYPDVKTISPWNEANHKSQPTAKRPDMAASYYNVVHKACSSCTIVAADVLGQKNMVPWLKAFKKKVNGSPSLWGLHDYTDTNRAVPWKKSYTKALLATVHGKVWLTEVGGLVAFNRTFTYNETRAAAAVKRALAVPSNSSRIKRVYLYSWFGQPKKTHGILPWDSGLVGPTGVPRKSYSVVKNWFVANGLITR